MKNLKPFKPVSINESIANEKEFRDEVFSILEMYAEPGGGYFMNDAEAEQLIKNVYALVKPDTTKNLRQWSLN